MPPAGKLIIYLLPLLLLATPASAQLIKEDWQCGQHIEITAALLNHFTSSNSFSGYADMPPYVAGTLKSDEGETLSVLFVHDATHWTGYAVQHQGGFPFVYTDATNARAVLFSMINVEGPGQDYTVLSTDDGFKHIACGTLPPPSTTLDTLDYMSITSLHLAADGHGLLHGRVDFSEGKAPECFASETKDGGKNWSVPQPVKPCIASIVSPVQQTPPMDDPVADLRASFH